MTFHSKRKRRAILAMASSLAFLFAATALAKRKNNSAQQSKATEPAKSSPEMDRLKFYLGEWDYTETYAKSPMFPDGAKNTGVYTSRLGPGGNSLVNGFHSQGPAGNFEALLIMTWDPKEKSYKEYVFGDGFPGAVVESGQFEGNDLVYRTEFTARGTTYKLRNVTRVVAPGKLVSEEYSQSKDAPESLLVRVEATKR
jgi:Protein of unknown function (DUF1579)